MRVKQKIISISFIAVFLLTVVFSFSLSVSANNCRLVVTNFGGAYSKYADHSVLTSWINSACMAGRLLDPDNDYTANYKYASCSAFYWNEEDNAYIKQGAVDSGYVNGIANTGVNGNLNVIDYLDHEPGQIPTDRIIAYGEIYKGGDKQSGRMDRIWIYRYKNTELKNSDPDLN